MITDAKAYAGVSTVSRQTIVRASDPRVEHDDRPHPGDEQPRHATRLLVTLLVALGIAMAWVAGGDGWTQSSHYALTRALASGTPRVDRYIAETGDISYTDGHYYSNKAPGLAIASLPLYFTLERTGLWPERRATQLWLLAVWGATIAAIGLVALTWRVGDMLDAGSGVVPAVALGAATMVLPFGSLAFSHVPSALVVFAAFAVLLGERSGASSPRRIVVAGALAGLAVCFEYQTALAGAVLALMAAARTRRVRRLAAYAAGFVVGVLPLLIYDWWAFGDPTHLSVDDSVVERGVTGHDVVGAHAHGFYGIERPSFSVAEKLFFEHRGLVVTTPIVVAAAAGLVLLARRGRRVEAATIAGVVVAYIVFNTGVTTTFGGPFGGTTPGPRYLVTMLPFLVAPLGLLYRRSPGIVLGTALVSLATMTAATVTNPLVESHQTREWWSRALHGDFVPSVPVLWMPGRNLVWGMVPFAVALVVVLVLAGWRAWAVRALTWKDAATTAATIGVWLVLIRVTSRLTVREGVAFDLLAFVAFGVAVTAVVLFVRHTDRRREPSAADAV